MRVPYVLVVTMVLIGSTGCVTRQKTPATATTLGASTPVGSAAPSSASAAPLASTPPTCAPQATNAAEMNARIGQIADLGWADAFRTARLLDGRWISFTGDGTRPGDPHVAFDNAAVIWDNQGQRRILTDDRHGNFFPRWPDGSEFWPGQQIVVGTTVFVIGSRQVVRGYLNWVPKGAYGAVVDVPVCGVPRFLRYFDTPSSNVDDTHVQWNGAMAMFGQYVYVHGMLDRPEAFHARDGGYVARTTVANLEHRRRWQYWTGSNWSGSPSAAVSTIATSRPQCPDEVGGTEGGYTLHRRPNGQWAITTKCGGSLAKKLGQYTGADPWGPWTWQPLLSLDPRDSYLAGAADTVPTTSGKLLVYWSQASNNPRWAEVGR